jgi:hypothetical protein
MRLGVMPRVPQADFPLLSFVRFFPPPLLSPAAPSGRTRRRVAGTLPLEVEVSLIAMEDEVSGAAVLRCSWTFSSPYIYLVCCLVLLSSLLQTLCSTRHCP